MNALRLKEQLRRAVSVTEEMIAELESPNGYCPICGDKCKERDREPHGFDVCASDHR